MRGASRKETDRSNVSWYGGKGVHAPVPGFCPQRAVREEEMEMHNAPDGADKSRRSQLMLVYLIFLAEA
jgi:hypothetical protein